MAAMYCQHPLIITKEGERKTQKKNHTNKNKLAACICLPFLYLQKTHIIQDGLQSSLYGGPQRIMPVYKQ
jgi:hypothetical protein